ncbi:PREDICTED: myb-binding protein 1A-like protein [Nicrophorus vespilloides]|uniref:Myb-binding protein 1A-like protein n=1 Tax=Nicrophorus vespilloides TaxID=110193 RepID=A0ABM1MSS1_NICVS|nr:PREDICTED: myb-binding protein 1A-like protein [Nicrophorus vespilloides]
MAAEEVHVVEEQAEEVKKNEEKKIKSVVDYFSHITKPDEKQRIKNGTQLIKYLSRDEKEENDSKYALNRLIRGLGATKNTARIGFYTALTTLLQTVEFNVEEILEISDKQIKNNANNSKSEAADISLGLILLSGAVLRSGMFLKISQEHQQTFINNLIICGNKKSYLGLISYTFLAEALQVVNKHEVEEVILPALKPEMTKPLSDLNLNHLYFLLKLQESYPKLFKKFVKNVSDCTDILSDVEGFVEILLGILPIHNILLHPVYEFAAKKVAVSSHAADFITQIDRSLIVKPTLIRHNAASMLLRLLAENLEDKTLLPTLLTKKFMSITITYLKKLGFKKEEDLQQSILKFLTSLTKAVNGENVATETKLEVINKLIFYPGSFMIEKLTKSKILQYITLTLDEDGVKKLCTVYSDVLLAKKIKQKNDNETEDWFNVDRVYAAQLIVKLLSHHSVKTCLEWKHEQLKMLMNISLFNGVGTQLAVPLKDIFFRALDIKLAKLDDLKSMLSILIHEIDGKLNESNYETEMCAPFSKEDFDLWKKGVDAVTKMENKTKKTHLNPVFHILFAQMSLQMFNDVKLAKDSLQELFECHARIKKAKKSKGENGDEEEIEWIEVVVDLFLNLLSHNSHLLRSIIGCVFPHLCKHLTASAIHQILSVLDPKDDFNPLGDDDSESDDSDEDENEEDEGKERPEDEEDSSLSDNDDYEETVNDRLRQAVREALGTNGAITDDESVDLDHMDDKECDKLNATLGAAFKQFKPPVENKKNKKQSKDDETLTHFRVRALDLISIYLDSDVSMILCLEIMLPLLQVLEYSIKSPHQKPLEDRVKVCLRKLTNLKKFGNVEEVTEDTLAKLLESFLDKGTKNTIMIHEMGDKISNCCIFIVRCMQFLGSQHAWKRIQSILNKALDNFFVMRECLTPIILFKNIMKLCWEGNAKFLPKIAKYAFDESMRPFRKSQALELLIIFYMNHRLLKDKQDAIKGKISKVEATIVEESLKIFKAGGAKDKFIINLFTLLRVMKTSPIKSEDINWTEIGEAVRDYRAGVNLKSVTKKSFNKLCQALNISHVVEMKETVVSINDNGEKAEDENKEKKRKKKHNLDELKEKKMSKHLRLEAESAGLNGHFSMLEEVEVPDEEENEGSNDGSSSNDDDDEKEEVEPEPVKINGSKKRSHGDTNKSPKKKMKKK